jgi:hypothetical protein
MDAESLLDTIRRLLALAESPNEHEAKAALAKAEDLMLRHNLSREEIDAATIGDGGYIEEEAATAGVLDTAWPFVAVILQQHFFVKILTRRCREAVDKPWHTTVSLFGRPANVRVAGHVAVYLMRKFRELWRAWHAPVRERRAFYHGLANGLDERLKAERKRIAAGESDCRALALSDHALSRAMAEHFGRVSRRRVRPISGTRAAYHAGRERAADIKLQESLASDRQRSLCFER